MSLQGGSAILRVMIYQIKIKGLLNRQWTDWFEGMAISSTEDGDALLTGPIEDQAALHGLLKKVRDLGMPLISVKLLFLQDRVPQNCKQEFPTFAGVNSPEMQRPL